MQPYIYMYNRWLTAVDDCTEMRLDNLEYCLQTIFFWISAVNLLEPVEIEAEITKMWLKV